MFGSLGAPELLIIAFLWVLPAVVLWKVAKARGQSGAYALWAILGYVGLIIGLLMMIAMPRPAPAFGVGAASSDDVPAPPKVL